MKKLYEDCPPCDYTAWFFHYDKYTGEGIEHSHTNNLMNGFM